MTDNTLHQWFGTTYFYTGLPTGERSASLSNCVRLLRDFTGGQDVRAKFMLTGTDKFSRTKVLGGATLQRFEHAVDAGDYSSVLLSTGSVEDPSLMLSVQLLHDQGQLHEALQAEFQSGPRSTSETRILEGYSIALWEALAPQYAFTVLAGSFSQVSQELSFVPVRPWDAERDAREEDRLFRLQSIRHLLGSHVHGASWAVFLGAALVERLGGFRSVSTNAPVETVLELPHGGAYLRLTNDPAPQGGELFAERAPVLESYLRTLLP